MKWFGYISFFAFLLLATTDCRQERNNADTAKLAQFDSLLSVQPEAALDSLELIETDNLNKYNKAYHQLLEVIAKDKTYFNFTSDSLINSTVDLLSAFRSKNPDYYARSLMYQGIVRYRMHITDSAAYQPLKEAAQIFHSLLPPDLINQYLCLYYIGEIHDKNNNIDVSKGYYRKAAQISKQLGDTSYLFSSYMNLFWNSVKKTDYLLANLYLDTLSHFLLKNEKFTISYKNMQSVYFESLGHYKKAIELEKEILQIKKKPEYQNTLIANFYNISKAYSNLNQTDSALKYAQLSVKAIQDTSHQLNHLYYLNLAKSAEKSGNSKLSIYGYKKTHELMSSNVNKNLDTKILELEKKYDLTEVENNALQLKNRAIILAGIVLLMLSAIIILLQHTIRQKQIKILTEERNRALENEKLLLYEKQQTLTDENSRNELELVKKKIILSFFQQISVQNLEIKKLLFDLKINTYITKNKTIYNKISDEYDNYNKKSKITETVTFDNDTFTKLTGISVEEAGKLNKSEKIMLQILALNAGNREMAVLLNTSDESIRSRKLKLKKKLEQLTIPIIKNLI